MTQSRRSLELSPLPSVLTAALAWQSDGEFPSFYASGDAFVLPSRGEGWGRPLVEVRPAEAAAAPPLRFALPMRVAAMKNTPLPAQPM